MKNNLLSVLAIFLSINVYADFIVECVSCTSVGNGSMAEPNHSCQNMVNLEISQIGLNGAIQIHYKINNGSPQVTMATVSNNKVNISGTLNQSNNPNLIVIDSLTKGNNVEVSMTNELYINISTAAQVNISGNSSICLGQSTTLTTTGFSSYLWGEGQTTNSITVSPTANQIYTLVATNMGGCTSSASKEVTVKPKPTAVATSNSPVCAGSTLNFMGSGGVSYSWSHMTSTFMSSQQNPSITNTTNQNSGNYKLVVMATNLCKDSVTISVEIKMPPTIIPSSNSPVCEGSTLSLQVNSGNSYNWSGPGGFTSLQQNPQIPNVGISAAGSYQVTLTGSNNCSSSQSLQVVVNAKPIVNINSNSPRCAGDNLSLQGSGGTSYEWTGPNNFSSMQQNPNINNVQTSAAGSYTLKVTNANNCTATSSQVIIVNPLTTLSLGNFDNTVCLDADPFSLIVLPQGGIFQSFSPGISSNGVFNPSETGVGIIPYTYTYNNANNCTSTLSGTVSVFDLPNPNIQVTDVSGIPGDNILCIGESITLQASSGGLSYLWSGNQVTNPTSQNIIVSPSEKSDYTLRVTDGNGCTATSRKTINIHQNPKALFTKVTAFDPLIYGQPFDLLNLSTLSPNATTNTYTWSFEPTNVINFAANTPNSTSLLNITAENNNNQASETVNIKLSIVDNNGCKDFKTDILRLRSSDCFATQLFDESIVYCVGDQINLNLSITVSSGAVLNSLEGFMILGSQRIPIQRIGSSTNFRLDAQTYPQVVNTPGDWIFEIVFSDNNTMICNNVKYQYSVKIEARPTVDWKSTAVDTICDENKAFNVPIVTNFNTLKFNSELLIKYYLKQNGVRVKEIIQSVTKSQTEIVLTYQDVIEVLNTGLFEIEIVEVTNTRSRCTPTVLSATKRFQLLPPIDIKYTDVNCEADSLFSVKITLSGGNEKFKLIPQIGVIKIDTISSQENMYRILFTLENYRLVVIGSKDFCDQKELNTMNLPRPSCDCNFVFENVKSGKINIINGSKFENSYRICQGDILNLQIEECKLEPTTDTLIIVIAEQAVSPSELLKQYITIFPSTTNDYVTYRASIHNVSPNKEYYAAAVVVQKNRNSPNGLESFDFTCRKVSPYEQILFYQNPAPKIDIATTKFCANQSNILVNAKNLVNQSVSGFISAEYNWKLSQNSTSKGFFRTINDALSSMYLSNTDTSSMYLLQFMEQCKYPANISCVGSEVVNIFTNNQTAPDTASIIYWPGNILVCTADSSKVTYKWGFVNNEGGAFTETILNNQKNKYLVVDDDIINNINKRIYFVEMKSRVGSNSCPTRTYFTATESLQRSILGVKTSINVFPNPSNEDHITFRLKGSEMGEYTCILRDVSGKIVEELQFEKQNFSEKFIWNHELPKGFYFVTFIHPSSQSIINIVISII
jgi:hypothetical protein